MKTGRRINLLVFPAETNALFALLMLAGVTLAVFLGYVIVSFWNNSVTTIELSLSTDAILASFLPIVCISGTMAGIIFGAAFLTYRRHPRRLRHRKNLLPLAQKDQVIQQAVEQLAAHAGVVPAPKIEMPNGLQGTSGQAFGVGKRYSIRLDGGLRVWRRARPDLFQAVVFHELAHIANQDIWRSYFSDGLWRAIIIWSLAPLILIIGGRFAWNSTASLLGGQLLAYWFQAVPSVMKIALQSALTVAVVTLIWARLLRTREFYADWRAARWGAEQALINIFRGGADRSAASAKSGLWRLHPSAAERLAVLEQPGSLLRISKVLTFVVGFLVPFVLLGIFFAGFGSFLILQAPLRALRDTSAGLLFWIARGAWFLLFFAYLLVAFAPLAWLVSGVLGSQVQKQSSLDLLEERTGIMPYLQLSLPALLLIAGVEVGSWVTPLDLLSPSGLVEIGIRIAFSIPMIALAWWFLVYIRFISIRLFAGYSGAKPPVWRMRSVTLASSLWLFLFFLPGLILVQLITGFAPGELGFTDLIYAILAWWLFVMVFSPLYLAVTWVTITVISSLQEQRCPACGEITRRSTPAIETCEHCGSALGEWLFVNERINECQLSEHS